DVGHREGLARAGDAEEHLVALMPVHALDQLRDGLGLVALWLELRDEAEGDAAFGFLGPGWAVGPENRHGAGYERMARHHRLARDELPTLLGALLRAGEQGFQHGGHALAPIGASARVAKGRQNTSVAWAPYHHVSARDQFRRNELPLWGLAKSGRRGRASGRLRGRRHRLSRTSARRARPGHRRLLRGTCHEPQYGALGSAAQVVVRPDVPAIAA